jgi:hypothetical protein
VDLAPCIERLGRALALAEKRPPHALREALRTPLAWLATQHASGRANDAAVAWVLEQALPLALHFVRVDPLAVDVLALLDEARATFLDRPDRPKELLPSRLPAPPRRPVATRGLPAVLSWAQEAPEEAPRTDPTPALTPERVEASAPSPRGITPPPREDLPALPPPVALADEGGEPVPYRRWLESVVHTAADRAGSAIRSRALRAFSRGAEADEVLFAQLDAIAACGPAARDALLAHWDIALESPHVHGNAAVASALAAFDGPEGLSALLPKLEQMPPDDAPRGRAVAEALGGSPHPELVSFARLLLVSRHPVARAVGVEVLGARRLLGAEELGRVLVDGSPPVLSAAARAVAAAEPKDVAALLPLLEAWVGLPFPDVVWESARAALLLGSAGPLLDLRQGRVRLDSLGARGVLLLALAGDASDGPLLEGLLARSTLTPAHLEALARFGHPGTWSFLVFALAQEELTDAASQALAFVFGDLVEPLELGNPVAWTAAIAAKGFDGRQRLRRGEPWSASALHQDLQRGEAPRRQMQADADELALRLGLGASVELGGLATAARLALRTFLDGAARHLDRVPSGGWPSRAR